jgi:CheY-like chemotaxis protein
MLLPHVSQESESDQKRETDITGGLSCGGPVGRIFVVDDDPNVRAFIAELLQEIGHKVEAFGGGEAALAELGRTVPDLLLVDYAMPGMNGAQLAREVRARHPKLPVVFITGFAESQQIEAAIGGDVPILRKPFGIDELAQTVAAYIGDSRLESPLS